MATSFRWTVTASAVVLLFAGPAWAQRQIQPPQRQQVQPQGGPQQRTTLRAVQGRQGETMADHEIATWLVLGNEKEVQVAQLAARNGHDNEVKKFAEQMIQEHGNLVNQLRQFAPDAPQLAANRSARNEAQPGQAAVAAQPERQQNRTQSPTAPGQAQPQTGQVQTQFAQHGGLPINQISYQLAERCLNSSERELSRKQGSEFDKCYIGMSIADHMAMLDVLETLKPYASQQLSASIDQAIPHVERHLAEAKKIGEHLWGGSTEQSQTGRREGDNSKQDQSQNRKD